MLARRVGRRGLSSFAAPVASTRHVVRASPSTQTHEVQAALPPEPPVQQSQNPSPALQSQPPKKGGRSLLQRVVLDRFSSKVREQREKDDISLIERYSTLALTLKTCVIPSEHPLNDIADHVRASIVSVEATPTATAQSLMASLVAELTPAPSAAELLARAKAQKVPFFRRLRNRLSFRRSTPAATAAAAAPGSPQASSPGAARLRDLMASFWPLLSDYEAVSETHSFVSFDADPSPVPPPRPRRGYELEWQFPYQAALRCSLLRHYLVRLSKALHEGEVAAAALSPEALARLCDAVLLGSASERLSCHLHLFASPFSQGQLQDCFYMVLEPEVEAAQSALLALRDLHPDARRALPKFTATYLLDRFELNVKSRCLFAWSDPDYKGFNQLSADLLVPLPQVLNSRRLYFPEGLAVASSFANDVCAERRMRYHDRRELNESLRNGAVFFAVCVLLDSFIQGL